MNFHKTLLNGIKSWGEAQLNDLRSWAEQKFGEGGLPTDGTAFQQLVTDADGNAGWENRTHYAMPHSGVIMPETTLEIDADSEGMAPIISALGLIEGRTYKVTLNGTDYESTAISVTIDENGTKGVLIGNPYVFGGTANELPFAVVEFDAETAAAQGVSGAFVALDGSTSAQIKIEATGEIVKTIDKKYIPDLGIPNVLVVHAWPADGSGNMLNGCKVEFDMSYDEIEEAEVNGAIVLMRAQLNSSNKSGEIFTRRNSTEFVNVEVTYNHATNSVSSIIAHVITPYKGIYNMSITSLN